MAIAPAASAAGAIPPPTAPHTSMAKTHVWKTFIAPLPACPAGSQPKVERKVNSPSQAVESAADFGTVHTRHLLSPHGRLAEERQCAGAAQGHAESAARRGRVQAALALAIPGSGLRSGD